MESSLTTESRLKQNALFVPWAPETRQKSHCYSDVRNFEGEVLEELKAEVHGEDKPAIRAEGVF